MKNICIIGAGGTGCTMAADMVLKGHEVTLYADPAWQGALEEGARRRRNPDDRQAATALPRFPVWKMT